MIENDRLKILQGVLSFKTQSEFAEALGIKQSTLSGIYHRVKGVGVSGSIKRILENQYNVNIDWLETGEGQMLKEDTHPERKAELMETSPNDTKGAVYDGALVYDMDASCGVVDRGWSQMKDKVIGSINLPGLKRSNPIIRAIGDSMQPVIQNGDYISVKQVKCPTDIFYGQIYLVVMEDMTLIKRIRKCSENEEEYVILRSENDDYDDMKVHRSKIKALFLVEAIISIRGLMQ